ncbi:hypothetical protein QR680_000190 [Steinernema hermaphroditum]|uniref:Uncharacterized protein n=1 Tax=Steinernema hermaphroditum TaxID=289476 RepID=A0AA39GTQ2_9BILA|nr:hypothetical protein QR680_000190 [Steinernema hermaphroditum]
MAPPKITGEVSKQTQRTRRHREKQKKMHVELDELREEKAQLKREVEELKSQHQMALEKKETEIRDVNKELAELKAYVHRLRIVNNELSQFIASMTIENQAMIGACNS